MERDRAESKDYTAYRNAFFVHPQPAPRFHFSGTPGVTLYYEDYDAAVAYYTRVLGPPAYVEGQGTRGWPVGSAWLTLLRGRSGNPTNVEVTFGVETPAEAERLQKAFVEAGGTGPAPTDELMYEPVRFCPVRDAFGVDLLVISSLGNKEV